MGCVVATTVLDTARTDAKITGYIHPGITHSEYRKPLTGLLSRLSPFLIPGSLAAKCPHGSFESSLTTLEPGWTWGWQSHNLFYTLLFRRQGCSRQFLRSFSASERKWVCWQNANHFFMWLFSLRMKSAPPDLLYLCSAPGYLQRIPALHLTLSAKIQKNFILPQVWAWRECYEWSEFDSLPSMTRNWEVAGAMVNAIPTPSASPPHRFAMPEDGTRW